MYGLPSRSEFLANTGMLEPIEFFGLALQRRRVWASAEFLMELEAMKQWPKDRDQYATPRQQVDAILREYVEGDRSFVDGYDFKRLRLSPSSSAGAVYELRPRDLRIFGAMVAKGEFCAVRALPKSELKKPHLYQPHIEHVRKFINSLVIPPPRIHDSRVDDVIEN